MVTILDAFKDVLFVEIDSLITFRKCNSCLSRCLRYCILLRTIDFKCYSLNCKQESCTIISVRSMH